MLRPNAHWLFGGAALAGFLLFGFAIGVLMGPPSQVVGDRLPELTCLQVAFTPARFSRFFLAFPVPMRTAIGELLVPGDLVFAWGYGLLLAGLTGLLAMRLPGRWQSVGALLLWAPLVASTFDCVEDVFLWTMAQQLLADERATLAAALPLLAGIAATIKYLALVVVTPAYGLTGIAKGFAVDRSIVALLLYGFLGLNLMLIILRPLQQLPPCF
jgi:hypothetical protein